MLGIQTLLSQRFRGLLCGDPSGIPPWLETIAEGNDRGLFLPNEAPWVVHADMATLVGGIRALLMQAIHPGSLAGVKSHSRYQNDPLGRLSGTIRWLTITTYASHSALKTEAQRVNQMHQRVKGTYSDAQGESRPYRAADPNLLRWVHIAFMDSFLRCHQNYSPIEIPGGADEYIRLWAQSVKPLGLDEVPLSEAELLETIERYRSECVINADTLEIIHWIKNPPLPSLAKPIYNLLFYAALATLPKEQQKAIGYRALPVYMVKPITRALLRFLAFVIGKENPILDTAILRLKRAGWNPELQAFDQDKS
jgi:uncharacterized protein (DUF2236 family)